MCVFINTTLCSIGRISDVPSSHHRELYSDAEGHGLGAQRRAENLLKNLRSRRLNMENNRSVDVDYLLHFALVL